MVISVTQDYHSILPSGGINSMKECVFFVNSALKLQYHIVKQYTPTDCFFDDFPTGFCQSSTDGNMKLQIFPEDFSCI